MQSKPKSFMEAEVLYKPVLQVAEHAWLWKEGSPQIDQILH